MSDYYNYFVGWSGTFTLTIILLAFLWKWKSKSNKCSLDSQSDGNVNLDDEYIIKSPWMALQFIFFAIQSSVKFFRAKETVFDKLADVFGNPENENPYATYVVKLFNRDIILPKDNKVIKEMLRGELFTDKYASVDFMEVYAQGRPKGLLANNWHEGKELKRYTMQMLGKLGFGRNDIMAPILRNQLEDFIENLENLRKSTGNKIQVQELFAVSMINIVWRLIGGDKFSPNDRRYYLLHKNVDILANFDTLKMVSFIFFPKNVISMLNKLRILDYSAFFDCMAALKKVFGEYIEERKLTLNRENPKDYVENFLLQVERYKDDDEFKTIYCEEQLATLLVDFFSGGMDPTSKFLELSMSFLTLNPYVQVKIQEEVDTVIGNSVPSYPDHRKSMPYTQATIMEVHRMSSMVPILPRMARVDCEIGGYQVKKGTQVGIIGCFHRMDKTYWGDPKVFRPERFFDSMGNLIIEKMNRVLPYGGGPRICVGESVATSTMFVFLTGILQKYNFAKSDQNEKPGIVKYFVPVSRPVPFHISLFPRYGNNNTFSEDKM